MDSSPFCGTAVYWLPGNIVEAKEEFASIATKIATI